MHILPSSTAYLIVLLTIGLTGCAAANLAQLQNDYDQLILRKKALADEQGKAIAADNLAEVAKPSGFPQQTPESLDPAFLSLATDAEAFADNKAKDPRTGVAALRLAGISAWQAGELGYDKAVKISVKGTSACKSLPKDKFGAPRDCALLLVVGDLARWDMLDGRVQTLAKRQDPNSSNALPADAKLAVEQLSTDLATAWKELGVRVEAVKGTPNVDASVTDYLSRQQRLAFCTYDNFVGIGRNLNGALAGLKTATCTPKPKLPVPESCQGAAGNFIDELCP